jgi:predicted DNA-binding helix-hairpin-helix protein
MQTLDKLRILAGAGRWDICSSTHTKRKGVLPGICHSFTPDGRCVSLLKVLYTNSCIHDCRYCKNSNCNDQKVSFNPDELAGLFMNFYVRNYVEGLFLSSGVSGDPDIITEQMIETATIIRKKHGFNGYIHLKVLPGLSYEQIKQLSELSDRLSINLESPNKSRFSELSSTKDYKIDLLRI